MTHRQFMVWILWLDEVQFDHPTLNQQYLMRVAQRIHQGHVEKPDDISLNHELVGPDDLKRSTAVARRTSMTAEEETRKMKAEWGARLGIKIPHGKNEPKGPIQLELKKDNVIRP